MSEEDRPLMCGVCGGVIRPDEAIVQRDDGVIAHVRCISAASVTDWESSRAVDRRPSRARDGWVKGVQQSRF